MSDGLGSVNYGYDQLSRLTSETRTLNGVGSFTFTYDYNLAGKPKTITDSTSSTIYYGYDNTGRINSVTGSPYGGVTNYASNFLYRAAGGLKRFAFGNSGQHSVSLTYTNRGRVNHYEVNYVMAGTITEGVNYQYAADGQVSYSNELTDSAQDRSYTYDHAGRLTQALTGGEARGEVSPDPNYIPFKQTYAFDAWSNMTNRTGQHWGHNSTALSATYVNNRNTNPQWVYDAAGDNVQQSTSQLTRQYTFDAAGREVATTEPPRRPGRPSLTVSQNYDGDGLRIKSTNNGVVSYQLRSSVLGGMVLMDLNAQGSKVTGYVYANGELLVKQQPNGVLTWVHPAPDGNGEWLSYGGTLSGSVRQTELDPMGDDVGVENPYLMGGDGLGGYPSFGDPTDMTSGCALDGSPINCNVIAKPISRNHDKYLSMVISGRIGSAIENRRADTVYDGKSILIDSGYEHLPNGDYQAFVTVTGTPAILQASASGYSMVDIYQRPVQVWRETQNADRRLTRDEYLALRKEVAKALKSEKCRGFIESLINKVTGQYFDSEEEFLVYSDAVFNNRGVFFTPGRVGSASIDDPGLPKIGLGPEVRMDLNLQGYAESLMHELIHGITGLGDRRIDINLKALGIVALDRDGTPMPFPTGKGYDYSEYFDRAVINACFPKSRL